MPEEKGKLIAVLDERRYLTGYKRKLKPGPLDVVVPDNCDLPANSTYKWDGKRFHPLGFDFPPVVTRPPATVDEVLFEIVGGLGKRAGEKALAWSEWYALNLKRREEEMSLRHRTPKIERASK